MPLRPTNTLILLSDEHNRDVLGCYGDTAVHTPHLDHLAKSGTVFENAYCNAPVCVSSRVSLATGLYPHQGRFWDSTTPYHGAPKGWAHAARNAGHDAVSIGKLHYRSRNDDVGFCDTVDPMHVHNGIGWMSSLLREPPVPIAGASQMADLAGAGETDYTRYDRASVAQACAWLRDKADARSEQPWVLQVGLVAPHFPLVSPPAFYDLYEHVTLPAARQYDEADRPRHPVIDALRRSSNYNDFFDEDRVAEARKAYYGLVSFLDHNIGRILSVLDDTGLREGTRILYTSDHGDNLGHRGLWGKSVMYDDAVAVPLLMSGPDVPCGMRVNTPVSLVDVAPTVQAFLGAEPDDTNAPGAPLIARVSNPDDDRAVFSEYHDWSSVTGMFMLRTLRWKIVRYPGYPDQLFDMQSDRHETTDLAPLEAYAEVLTDMRARLAAVADIEAANAQAFADQRAKIAAFGGAEAILAMEEKGYTPAPHQGAPLADPFEP